ncbi:glycosyltransferase [Peribacillus frigoritolerans]|uniref:glycosyltransferase n=1 Tax=Peribacillus frigoritolerans TaxID=450367 RepID=UPI0021D2195C|nr:glycosyltransferase [Peribacillus frigoritolerans]MCU6600458.1 glycosyltransferase [Peribacillus frigoritolerans]
MGKYLFDILNENEEFKIKVLTRRHKGVKFSEFIDRVSYLPKAFFIPYYNYLRKLKDLNEFDYIILNGVPSTIIGSWCLPRSLWEKCIVYIHGTELENYQRQSLFSKNTLYKNYFPLIKASGKIVFCSKFLMDKFKENGVVGDFVTISNFIDKNTFYKIDDYPRKNILLSVGRITKTKGYDLMLDDFKELINKGYDYKWWIIGEGPYKKSLEFKIKNLKLSKHVLLLGKKPIEQLNRYYSQAKLFWLYSESESFGLSYLEANMCGIPFIAKKIPGLEEIRNNEVNSYYRENYGSFSDFIDFLESEDEKQQKELEIITFARQFSKQKFEEKWLDLLSK